LKQLRDPATFGLKVDKLESQTTGRKKPQVVVSLMSLPSPF
jgi:hypothetical protein